MQHESKCEQNQGYDKRRMLEANAMAKQTEYGNWKKEKSTVIDVVQEE